MSCRRRKRAQIVSFVIRRLLEPIARVLLMMTRTLNTCFHHHHPKVLLSVSFICYLVHPK